MAGAGGLGDGLSACRGAPGAEFRHSVRATRPAKGSRTFANVGGTAIAPLCGCTRHVDMKGTAMHIKGVLLALAVAARVAVLVPAFVLAWLIWQR